MSLMSLSSGSSAQAQSSFQLLHGRRAFRTALGPINPAGQDVGRGLVREVILAIDQDGRRAPEAHPLGLRRRVDLLEHDLFVLTARSAKGLLQALVGDLPVWTSIEVTKPDSHSPVTPPIPAPI